MIDTSNVFGWLDSVRERPLMYAANITDLCTLVYGYYAALYTHNIIEPVPQMTDKFNVWAQVKTGWSGFNCGWGYAFDNNTPPDSEPFPHFFEYVDQYRALTPDITARVTLRPEHHPTGRRCVIGHNGRMERPDEILVVNYAPTSLNHLRHRYEDRYVDDWFLMLGDGSHDTAQSDLFDWVSDEFGIGHSEWELVTHKTA